MTAEVSRFLFEIEVERIAVHKISKLNDEEDQIQRMQRLMSKAKGKIMKAQVFTSEIQMDILEKSEVKRIDFDRLLSVTHSRDVSKAMVFVQRKPGKNTPFIIGLRFKSEEHFHSVLNLVQIKSEACSAMPYSRTPSPPMGASSQLPVQVRLQADAKKPLYIPEFHSYRIPEHRTLIHILIY